MARLNEPMISTDSIETLRRKFLRQNRDIARTNSTQSLKIRNLENECARMLSDNLALRGQIIRLESELRDSRAQRISDHALEIKERMEAQLVEWGAMLASLGNEPIQRNRSPRLPKKAKTRSSLCQGNLSEWRRRETISSMKDLEAVALSEGRLPPLWENKPCPRETLNQEEILAICSQANDNTDSPDLGPPPVSRFVDEDPVKIDLPKRPAKPIIMPSDHTKIVADSVSESKKPSITSALNETPVESTKAEASTRQSIPRKDESVVNVTAPSESQAPSQAAKANLKRKAREDDEKENNLGSKPPPQPTPATKSQTEKGSHFKAKPINRPVKELPPGRRDGRGKPSVPTQRKPLGMKSSNEVLNSPKKSNKPPVTDVIAKAKANAKRDEVGKERLEQKQDVVPLVVPASESAVPIKPVEIEIEPEGLSAEPHLAPPDSPVHTVPDEEVRDTPPPLDISSRGETIRGSRRAKATISYAEPNLRDKMRRPTKQLFDAVSGEGKHQMRRAGHSQKDEAPSNSASVVKSEAEPGESESWKDLPLAPGADPDAELVKDVMASPLVQKSCRMSPADLPTSGVTERKKRSSVTPAPGKDEAVASMGGTTASAARGPNRRLEEIAAQEAKVAEMFDDGSADIYEFTTSTPKDSSPRPSPTPEEGIKRSKGRPRNSSRARRLSTMAAGDLEQRPGTHAESEKNGNSNNSKNNNDKAARHPAGCRKRASMMEPRRSRTESSGDQALPDASCSSSPAHGDSSLESTSSPADGASSTTTRDRASMRRRSMIL